MRLDTSSVRRPAIFHYVPGIETNEDGSVKCFKMRDGKEIVADEYVSSVPKRQVFPWESHSSTDMQPPGMKYG